MKKFLIFLALSVGFLQADLPQNQIVNTSVNILKIFKNDFYDKKATAKMPIGFTGKMPKSFTKDKIKAIAIIPDLIKIGVGTSFQKGEGIFCIKDEKNTWSDPLFITVKGIGAGLQAGYISSDAVILFANHRSYSNIFKDDSITFGIGADLSIVGGASTHSSTDFPELGANIFAFGRSNGMFIGISLEGLKLKVHDQNNIDYYDRIYKYEDILNGSPKDSKYTKKLKVALENIF